MLCRGREEARFEKWLSGDCERPSRGSLIKGRPVTTVHFDGENGLEDGKMGQVRALHSMFT
jgi:hypothetical protein